jgi:hypothetical protein
MQNAAQCAAFNSTMRPFLRNQLAAASGMSRCRFMTILLSAPR